jgi:hypothetical protein
MEFRVFTLILRPMVDTLFNGISCSRLCQLAKSLKFTSRIAYVSWTSPRKSKPYSCLEIFAILGIVVVDAKELLIWKNRNIVSKDKIGRRVKWKNNAHLNVKDQSCSSGYDSSSWIGQARLFKSGQPAWKQQMFVSSCSLPPPSP